MISFQCASCGKRLKVKAEFSGKRARCPLCQAAVLVPAAVPSETREGRGVRPAREPAPEEGRQESISEAATVTPADPNHAGGDTDLFSAAPRQDQQHLIDFLAPPQDSSELGRLGPYRVLRILGHGGMGVVFEAEDPQLRRKVALKAMLPALAASETARQRFLREAQTAAAIEHDHIVPIYQVGEDRGVPFIAMPLLRGEPLDRRLEREPLLDLAEVVRIGRETAAGLAAAHKQGLIHRDIKPANLWLEDLGERGVSTSRYRVRILDFGLARAAADKAQLTQSGAILGTPAFMAPEQVDGRTLDARCDLFSVGCVLYRISTGRLPFKGADTISTLIAVATQMPRPPKQINASLPQEFSDLVMQLLAKDPAHRTASAQALFEALGRIEEPWSTRTTSYAHGGVTPSAPTSASNVEARSCDPAKPKMAALSRDRTDLVKRYPERVVDRTPDRPKQHPKEGRSKNRTRSADRRGIGWPAIGRANRLWLILAGVAAVLLIGLVSLWAGGVFKVKTKDGILVVEVNEPNPDMYVDGEKVTVTWDNGGKKAEIRIKPGTRKVEVKKDGFVASGEEVEVAEEGQTRLRAHLEPGVAAAARQAGLSLRPLNRTAFVRVGQWRVEGDQLIQEDATTAYPDILFGGFEWTDYDFSAQARRVEGNDFFALFCRWFDGNAFKFQVSSGFGNCLSRLDQDAWAVVTHSPFSIQNDVLYKTVMKVRGNRYQVVINNQVITDYVDPMNVSGQGRVGLGTNMAACRFTKIEVRSRAGKLLWTGPPDIDPPKSAVGDRPFAMGLEPLEQTAPKQGAPEPASPSRTLLPGSVLVGINQRDSGASGPVRIEITERTDDAFKGSLTGDGFFGMRTFALAGTLRGSEIKYEYGNVLMKQGKLPELAANNIGFVGKFERGTLEGRYSTHDEKNKGVLKLNLAAVHTGTYEYVTGAAAKGVLRIEITERQENHFKGTLTSDDGPTTWVITGTVANGEVQWQWGDMACKDGCSSEKLTNNCRFVGTCKDGIVQGRFSTLDNAQTGSLRAVLVGLKSAAGK